MHETCPIKAEIFLKIAVAGVLASAAGRSLVAQQASPASAPSPAPLVVTFEDALKRAQVNVPEYRAALTRYGVARENKVQSRAALLPNVAYNAGFTYTEGNRVGLGRFIANNGVHEYLSQGNAHEAISLQSIAEFRGAQAREALAKAQSQIAERGLVATLTQAYYGSVVGERKYSIAERGAQEAQRFLDITQKRERGGEVAHSDTIKAQLQQEQQQRALEEARLEMGRSRLELAVLIFPDFNQNFTTVDDLDSVSPLPAMTEVEAMASKNNPQLGSALASLRAANQQVAAAWNSFLPSLTVDYFYGIDANQFAATGVDQTVTPHLRLRNLGYSAAATVDLPIWSWGAGRSRVKSAHLERDQARVELSFAQRKLAADLNNFYNEAQTSRSALELLRHSAELAAESLRLTTLRYQAGEVSVLEVVDAQNTLTQAGNAFGDGQVRFRVAVANLQTLTGKF